MIWSLICSLFGGLWKLAKLVPWYVWVIAAVAGYGWHWHNGKVEAAHDAGVQEERAEWVRTQKESKERAEREAKEKQAQIDKEAASSKRAADIRFLFLETEAKTLREKLRHANQPKPGAPTGAAADCRISDERRDLLNQALGYE